MPNEKKEAAAGGTGGGGEESGTATAKPKRATKVMAKAEVEDANGTAEAKKPAAKAKTTKKAAAAVSSGEVAS